MYQGNKEKDTTKRSCSDDGVYHENMHASNHPDGPGMYQWNIEPIYPAPVEEKDTNKRSRIDDLTDEMKDFLDKYEQVQVMKRKEKRVTLTQVDVKLEKILNILCSLTSVQEVDAGNQQFYNKSDYYEKLNTCSNSGSFPEL